MKWRLLGGASAKMALWMSIIGVAHFANPEHPEIDVFNFFKVKFLTHLYEIDENIRTDLLEIMPS